MYFDFFAKTWTIFIFHACLRCGLHYTYFIALISLLPDACSFYYSSETVLASKECIAATIRSYKNKAGLTPFHLDHMYIMTTNCFNDGINLTLLASCQSPDTESFSDIVPVTSLETGTTYGTEHVLSAIATLMTSWSGHPPLYLDESSHFSRIHLSLNHTQIQLKNYSSVLLSRCSLI